MNVYVRPHIEKEAVYSLFILNQILIHILWWLGRSSETDRFIIHHNKKEPVSQSISLPGHVLSTREVLLYESEACEAPSIKNHI